MSNFSIEEKVELLQRLNKFDYDEDFLNHYRALAKGITTGIQKRLNSSRSEVREVREDRPKSYSDTWCFDGKEATRVSDKQEVSTFSVMAADELNIGTITPEDVESLIDHIVDAVLKKENEAVEKICKAANVMPSDLTIWVNQSFQAVDDLTMLKRKKLGFFGWEDIAITT